jgi:NADH-quinone oxidoreductase subunit G
VAKKFTKTLADNGTFGVIGSNHTTNEENFYLQKFARKVLHTNNVDHHRTGDVVTLLDALSEAGQGKLASVADLYERKAFLILGADLALEHPLLSNQIRSNFRHHQARIYVVTEKPVREDKYCAASLRGRDYSSLTEKLQKESELVIVFDDSYCGEDVRKLVAFGTSLGIPVSYVPLVDYSNSRGAIDMGMVPELLPGYKPSGQPGLHVNEMLEGNLDVLWVVGANPFKAGGKKPAFLVVQDLFLTETASQADIVLPAACAYEKYGTITNVTGEVQRLKLAINTMGAKPDLDIMGFIAREMSAAAILGPWFPDTITDQIVKTVHGYKVPMATLATGGAAQTMPVNGRISPGTLPGLVHSDHNGLFASGTLGRYSKVLNSVVENRARH